MARSTDTYGMLYQNLLDAGCKEEIIEKCMAYAKQDQWVKMLPLLAMEKASRLITMHTSQKQIDCLDFLVYQLRKESK